MNTYNEVTGDLITLAQEGHFDVIAHGCNCHSAMGAGIAPQMAKAFGADNFPMEMYDAGNMDKLGNIDYRKLILRLPINIEREYEKFALYVVNAYTQFGLGMNHEDGSKIPLSYAALTLCLRKINFKFAGKSIGLPKIGCGLAGGDWNIVRELIRTELVNMESVTIVNYIHDRENILSPMQEESQG